MFKITLLFLIFAILGPSPASAQNRSGRIFSQPAFTASQIVQALQQAYPEKVERIQYRNNDWALLIRGNWYYWAEGRLLPATMRTRSEDYSPLPFYPYSPLYNPPLPEFTEEQKQDLNRRLENRERQPISRHPGFYNALYRLYDEESAWQMMKTTYFLGHKVLIHRDLLEDLARVEESLQETIQTNTALREYVNSIRVLAGFNWRTIDGTSTLSNHAYGTAIDIIPQSYEGKQAYWRWFMEDYPEWYSLPWERRHVPPEPFVRAFEEEGFIWGGKWFFFDGIHFEYRPEILILNGLR